MLHSAWKPARRLALGLVLVAAPAFANFDGTLDASLDPPLGADPFYGIPGLFDYEADLGGGSPYTNNDYAAATAVQVDGKIVVAGFSWNTYLGVDQNACVLARFNADGSLDSGFGGGRIVINFSPSAGENDCYLDAIALQGDGKIVVAGNLTDATHGERGIVFRYNANGTRDAAFDNGVSGQAGYVVAGDNSAFSSVTLASDGSIITAGHGIQGGHTDEDFFYEAWAGDNGDAEYWNWAAFNLGADDDDRAYAVVLERNVCIGLPCFVHDELYLVGSANNAAYGDGLTNHDCAIAAYYKGLTDSQFSVDTSFNGSGLETIDFPVAPANEGDNICRAAASRPGYGLVIGGENYFISTLGGGTPGLASNYALAEVDVEGNVTRQDAFAYFQDLAYPGIFNGIFGIAHEPNGKLVVNGYAGSSDANRQPSDAGVIRFNADFSRDSTFGNDGDGLAILSLDGLGGLLAHQREWATALALDDRGHIVVTGERSVIYGVDNDYDWLVGRLDTSDEIFRDSYDGIVPPVQ
ncbi:MAG TPA: hypothetical protein VF409_09495 [Sphingomonas sp.]